MIKKYILKKYKLTLFLVIIFALMGCNANPQKPNPQENTDNSPKLPKVLTELEDEVLTIMYDLDSVTGIEKAMQEKAMQEQEMMATETAAKPAEDGQGSQESESSEKENSEKPEEKIDLPELIKENEIIIPLLDAGEVKGTFAESPNLPKDMDEVWNQISDSVTQVHKKWNVLEAQLTPVNVPKEKSEEFENILDNLTMSIMSKNKLESLKIANELTRITTDFRSYFNGVADHSVYSMYYHIRSSILLAVSNDYKGALEHVEETSKAGGGIRQDLIKKDAQDVLQKFELSIEDLKKQLLAENFSLSQIKAPIVIKNIKLIQDTFKAN